MPVYTFTNFDDPSASTGTTQDGASMVMHRIVGLYQNGVPSLNPLPTAADKALGQALDEGNKGG